MTSQLFQKNINNKFLFDLLEECSTIKGNSYIFSKASFKCAQFKNIIEPFCDKLKECYYPSKQHYITRKMIYKTFITVLRQVCKFKSIPFVTFLIIS